MPARPLSVPLSQLLVAFTIELDNAFEHRIAAALERPFRVSVVMWSNFLRFVGTGIPVGELPAAAGLPKARILSTLGGMERWRYVFVTPPDRRAQGQTRRDGFGSARGLRAEWVVRPTATGSAAQEIWPRLFAEIEDRWSSRFGSTEVAELRAACLAVAYGLEQQLPEFLPIVTGTNGMASEVGASGAGPSEPIPLLSLMANVLLSYTLGFERDAPLSLPIAENVVRVLDGTTSIEVRELPRAAAVSPEATTMALTYLRRKGYVGGTKAVRLTPAGTSARAAAQSTHASVESAWKRRLGGTRVERLREALHAILDQRNGERLRIALGLEPYADGWRTEARYAERTMAMLADPVAGLPRHPMILHRGGWPDGS